MEKNGTNFSGQPSLTNVIFRNWWAETIKTEKIYIIRYTKEVTFFYHLQFSVLCFWIQVVLYFSYQQSRTEFGKELEEKAFDSGQNRSAQTLTTPFYMFQIWPSCSLELPFECTLPGKFLRQKHRCDIPLFCFWETPLSVGQYVPNNQHTSAFCHAESSSQIIHFWL